MYVMAKDIHRQCQTDTQTLQQKTRDRKQLQIIVQQAVSSQHRRMINMHHAWTLWMDAWTAVLTCDSQWCSQEFVTGSA